MYKILPICESKQAVILRGQPVFNAFINMYAKTYKKTRINIHKLLDFFLKRRYNLSHKYAGNATEEEKL